MKTSVTLYWWLAFNIGLFYVLIAYGLSLWGAYLCWAQQEEEELVKAALQHKYEKMKSEGMASQNGNLLANPLNNSDKSPLMIDQA